MSGPCVAIIGLGYVGLPLAVALGRTTPTIGFDRSGSRIQELRKGHDRNGDVPSEALGATGVAFTDAPEDLVRADVFVIAVPTPVDAAKNPDLSYLRGASDVVGRILAARAARTREPAIVVYESTVFPGCTEEVCMPELERASGLQGGTDFKVAYSPERINPGDQEHTLETIVKVVAGQDAPTLEAVARLYERVVKAGVYRAPDIRTAEAAKVIENTQRDLNIALMNELAVIFHRLGLDTHEVLKAARTKWNFLPFTPGLVGGHCIPEDPYYLTHKAAAVGHDPQVILAGRRINDGMGAWIARETVKLIGQAGRLGPKARVLILGVAFKENVRDTRNTRVVDLVRELQAHGLAVDVHDPVVGAEGVRALGLQALPDLAGLEGRYEAIVLAVPHDRFVEMATADLARLAAASERPAPFIDVKAALRGTTLAGFVYWSL